MGRAERGAERRHVPVMLDRVVALLAPALARPGAVLVDATLGLGGHSEAFLQQFPGGPPDRARPRPRRPAAGRRPARAVRRADHPGARGVRRAAAGARRPRRPRDRRHPVRPGRLLDAAGRGRPRFRLRAGRAAGHADGQHRADHGRRHPEHLQLGRPGPDPVPVRRGEVLPPDRGPDRQGRARPSRSRTAPGCPSWSATRSRRRPAGPGDTRPSGPSRRCGSR